VRALLLDFGGVIVEGPVQTAASLAALAGEVDKLIDGAVSPDRVRQDLRSGLRAYALWRDAMSRPYAPRELSQAEVWGDFIAGDWPAPARAAVQDAAPYLCHGLVARSAGWRLREGIADVFAAAAERGAPVAIVSNTICGAAVRDFLHTAGLRPVVEVYSHEVGVRKPNPEMLYIATRALSVSPSDAWFVGDMLDRDVLCARRAGIGRAVLLRPVRAPAPAYPVACEPDITLDAASELADLIRAW
jgi:FMN phosphatase YigB (HAD superfamily)